MSDRTQSDSTVSTSPANDSPANDSPANDSPVSASPVSASPDHASPASATASSPASDSPVSPDATSPAPVAEAPVTAPAASESAASQAAAAPDAASDAPAVDSPASETPAASTTPRQPITARVVVVTSGKGGVGKTTTSASFAAGLALRGHKTAVIDFDIGLRNLDLIMGCERRVVYDLINVIQGEATLNQALVRDKQVDKLYVLAASQTRDKEALTLEGIERILRELSTMDFEYIVCDSPAGIETGALTAMHFADEALIVTNPEVSSVRDSDRILGMLGSKTQRAIDGREPIKEHLLITRYNPARVKDGQMLSLDDIQDILRIKLIGIIPESETVLQASNQGMPSIHMQGSDVAEAYGDVILRFLGQERPMRFIEAQKQGFFRRMFGGR